MTSIIEIDRIEERNPDVLNVSPFHRPSLYQLMHSTLMDKPYVKAQGAYLYFKGRSQEMTPVIDFAGGYGSTFFGHNPEQFVELIKQHLEAKTPIHAQGGLRRHTVRLSTLLHDVMQQKTGKSYFSQFANTGAEAVDMAIKHCTLNWHNRLHNAYQRCQSQNELMRCQKFEGVLSWDKESISTLVELGVNDIALDDIEYANKHIASAMRSISEFNQRELNRSCRFLALTRAFHGKTVGATQLTYNEYYREPFKQFGPQVQFVEPEDLDFLNSELNANPVRLIKLSEHKLELRVTTIELSDVAGFFLEPIQGEGGIREMSAPFLQQAFALCRQHNVATVVDEIQTGLGRTGHLLYSLQQGIVADYYLLSKALGAGMCKISAMLVDEKRYCPDFDFIQTSTFAEDDLSSAVACRVIESLEFGDYYKRASSLGEYLKSQLEKLQQDHPQIIKEIRGVGLLLGVHFNEAFFESGLQYLLKQSGLLSNAICAYLLNVFNVRAAATLSDPCTIRIEPSIEVCHEDIDQLVRALDRVCFILSRKNGYELIKPVLGIATDGTEECEDFSHRQNRVDIPQRGKTPRVAFLMHLFKASDWHWVDPSLAPVEDAQAESLMTALLPYLRPFTSDFKVVTSATGEQVELVIYGVCMSSWMIASQLRKPRDNPALRIIQQAVQQAELDGCDVVGFGGLNSIAAQNCKAIYAPNQVVTTGNAFTVAMGLKAIEACIEQTGLGWSETRVAMVGAMGNICDVYTQVIADRVSQLILIGRANTLPRLERFAKKIYAQQISRVQTALRHNTTEQLTGIAKVLMNHDALRPLLYDENFMDGSPEQWVDNVFEQFQLSSLEQRPIRVEDNLYALKSAQVIVSASNSHEPIIFPDMLSDDPVYLCDIAMPPDVHPAVITQCPQARLFTGGLVQLAENTSFHIEGLDVPKGQTLACLSETLLLGLENFKRHFSYGDITPDQVALVESFGHKHGFVLGNLSLERKF